MRPELYSPQPVKESQSLKPSSPYLANTASKTTIQSDQNDQREERDSFKETKDVEQRVPTVSATGALDVRFIFGFTEEIQSFENQNHENEEMDVKHGQSLLVQNEDPKSGEEEIAQG